MRATLESEIVSLLSLRRGHWQTSYDITSAIESKWEREGRRSRFLFWTFPPLIGHGTLFRALDRLVSLGTVERQTRQVEGRMKRVEWRII